MKIDAKDYRFLSKKDYHDFQEFKKRIDNRSVSKKKKKKKKKKCSDNLSRLADSLRGKPYSEFLKSRYWYIVREKVLKRDGFKCVICSKPYSLEIHHDSYKNHFREHLNLSDLMTLCKSCHREHHYAQL